MGKRHHVNGSEIETVSIVYANNKVIDVLLTLCILIISVGQFVI